MQCMLTSVRYKHVSNSTYCQSYVYKLKGEGDCLLTIYLYQEHSHRVRIVDYLLEDPSVASAATVL